MEDDLSPMAPQAQVGPGTTLNNTYEIDCLIASGGMGDIYRGHAIHTEGAVAIKIIRTDLKSNPAALDLFRREASALNKLYHGNRLLLWVFLRTIPFVSCIISRWSSWTALRCRSSYKKDHCPLRQRTPCDGELRPACRPRTERGIVHRDVSPDNIIVPGADLTRAKIIDFGISRLIGLDQRTIIGGGFAGKI